MGISPNRIELESQILCASMRQSWAQEDTHGVIVVAKQLCQLFPDLMRPVPEDEDGHDKPLDLYEFLGLKCDATQNIVASAYIHALSKFMQGYDIHDTAEEFYTLLDAGYILRKPRLRLSHDLYAVRQWLLNREAIPADGTIDFLEAVEEEKLPAVAEVPVKLPQLIYLLQQSQIIGQPEVLALTNQIKLAPEVSVEELILSAGYVNENELKSLQLAEYLLNQGKITMPQFIVAMYDERERGIRMAESLQSRGWLEVQVKTFSGD